MYQEFHLYAKLWGKVICNTAHRFLTCGIKIKQFIEDIQTKIPPEVNPYIRLCHK